MHLVIVILGVLLFPKALSALKCHQCTEGGVTGTGTCTNTVHCSESASCGALTTRTSVGEITVDVNMKTCVLSAGCGNSGTMNFGLQRSVVSSKCCSTDLCNVQSPTPPASPSDFPNGNKCYTCNDNDCSDILSCAGDEDRCITSRAEVKGHARTNKGCVSKSLCVSSDTHAHIHTHPHSIAGVTVEVSCCEGDLCNSATSTAVSVLLLLAAPVISVVLFN